jgi:hypothetical protein
MLIDLSQCKAMIPSSLFLKRVEADRMQDPIGVGGFADVFCGSYEGEDVALKRLRVFQMLSPDDKVALHQVIGSSLIPTE